MSDSEIQKESILKEEIKAKIIFLFFFSPLLYDRVKKNGGEMKIMEKYSQNPEAQMKL